MNRCVWRGEGGKEGGREGGKESLEESRHCCYGLWLLLLLRRPFSIDIGGDISYLIESSHYSRIHRRSRNDPLPILPPAFFFFLIHYCYYFYYYYYHYYFHSAPRRKRRRRRRRRRRRLRKEEEEEVEGSIAPSLPLFNEFN